MGGWGHRSYDGVDLKEGPALVADVYTFVATVRGKMMKLLHSWVDGKSIYLEI